MGRQGTSYDSGSRSIATNWESRAPSVRSLPHGHHAKSDFRSHHENEFVDFDRERLMLKMLDKGHSWLLPM
jgi:hypothetical protein